MGKKQWDKNTNGQWNTLSIVVELFRRYFSGTATAQEKKAIETWVPIENEKELLEDKKLSEQCDTVQVWNQVIHKLQLNKKQTVLAIAWPKIKYVAATVAIVISIFSLLYFTNNAFTSKTFFAKQSRLVEQSTKYGEISDIVLSDGSTIKLSAESKACFDDKFYGKTRNVRLNGEAFFDVAHNKNKPFIVKAGILNVTVLGTAFDVKSYDNDNYACVTVVRGRVKVSSPTKEYVIIPNEQVYFDKETGELIKRNVISKNYTEWATGTLYFNETTIKNLINQLERWYGVTISVSNPEILTKKISGEYSNKQIIPILEAIKFTLNINYQINGNNIMLN